MDARLTATTVRVGSRMESSSEPDPGTTVGAVHIMDARMAADLWAGALTDVDLTDVGLRVIRCVAGLKGAAGLPEEGSGAAAKKLL
jgi:hypothetical protein